MKFPLLHEVKKFKFGFGHYQSLESNNANGFLFHILQSLKFIYSEKPTKFCEIFTLLLTTGHKGAFNNYVDKKGGRGG